MAEYIERENYCKNICLCSEDLCEKEKCPIWRASTADVAPVRHGHWEIEKEDIEWGSSLKRFYCTECGERPYFDKESWNFILTPYCHNCGAKMDGDKNGA